MSEAEAGPRRGRLLLFNLAVDADDPTLAFASGWVDAFAALYEHVDVVTMRVGAVEVAPNVEVRSLGKERGWSEPRRAIEFYRHVGGLLATRRYDACFVHMVPMFAALALPMLLARRVPVVVWYAAQERLPSARLVGPFVTFVTATRRSFPLGGPVVCVGHGIDTSVFGPGARDEHDGVRLLTAGRVTPTKRLDVMIRAVDILRRDGVDARLEIAGPVDPRRDASHAENLARLRDDLGLEDAVTFIGPVARSCMPAAYRRADVFIDLFGLSLDKTLLEAMASGVVVVGAAGAEPVLAPVDSRLVTDATPVGVAGAVRRVAEMDTSARVELGNRLREAVLRDHDLRDVAPRIYRAMSSSR